MVTSIILSVSLIHDNMMLVGMSIDEYGYINEMDMSRRGKVLRVFEKRRVTQDSRMRR